MLKLALRRIAALIPTLLIIVTVSFAIIRLAPGGPFDAEQGVSPAVRANLERLYGLDAPLGVQYLRYLHALAHGDFGPSLRQRDFTVSELIRQGLPLAGWQPGAARYLVLPVVTLALPLAVALARLTRASLLEVLRAPFVRSARARGLGAARVLWHHALRPALLPVVSYL